LSAKKKTGRLPGFFLRDQIIVETVDRQVAAGSNPAPIIPGAAALSGPRDRLAGLCRFLRPDPGNARPSTLRIAPPRQQGTSLLWGDIADCSLAKFLDQGISYASGVVHVLPCCAAKSNELHPA
jgi:hypothetical protein